MTSKHLDTPAQINTVAIIVILLAITVLALFLRLHLLGQNSFWGDELASVRRAQLDWDAFWELMRGPAAMALYYALLRFWILLGDSEFTVRLLSVIPAVATVPVVYFLGKSLFDARVGLIAALLLAMNAFHIQYSQEARSYSLLILLVTLSSLFLARGIRHPSRTNWIGYAVTSALSVYAHPFALLVLLTQVSSLAFLPWRDIPWNQLRLSGLALGIALLPVLMPTAAGFLGFDSTADEAPLGWIPQISLDRAHSLAVDLTGKDGDLLFIAYLS
jgi:mannosyltransferase